MPQFLFEIIVKWRINSCLFDKYLSLTGFPSSSSCWIHLYCPGQGSDPSWLKEYSLLSITVFRSKHTPFISKLIPLCPAIMSLTHFSCSNWRLSPPPKTILSWHHCAWFPVLVNAELSCRQSHQNQFVEVPVVPYVIGLNRSVYLLVKLTSWDGLFSVLLKLESGWVANHCCSPGWCVLCSAKGGVAALLLAIEADQKWTHFFSRTRSSEDGSEFSFLHLVDVIVGERADFHHE